MAHAEFYAVPDPNDPQRMTYWRRHSGIYLPHPKSARYAPLPPESEIPIWMTGRRRQDWIREWARPRWPAWRDAVYAAIDADPAAAAARYAMTAVRCCQCGRKLTDPTSRSYGVGPECREGWPADLLATMAAMVAREQGRAPAS